MPQRAIDLALDLARTPTLARFLREQPLPDDVLDVIRIAAGCPEASQAARVATGQPLPVLQRAVVFYLQEMLFFPGAGLYRNLGVAPDASRAQMRLHMRWLMRWLHPDHNKDETAALLAQRVIYAWRELGGRNRKEAAPHEPTVTQPGAPPRRAAKMRVPWIPIPIEPASSEVGRGVRTLALVLGLAAAFALLFVPDAILFGDFPIKDAQVSVASPGTRVTAIDFTGK